MRIAAAGAVFLFLASVAVAQTPGAPGWKLVWSDEFNYTGHPDPSKWGYEEGYVRHDAALPQFMTVDYVRIYQRQ